jgi:mono/diheme cytochrome c family protein
MTGYTYGVGRRWIASLTVCAAFLIAAPDAGRAQDADAEQAQAGGKIYARNCSPCHGARMRDPEGAFDLRKFPHDNKKRFTTSVTNGKGQMPPWGGLLSQADIDSVWAYVLAGEK